MRRVFPRWTISSCSALRPIPGRVRATLSFVRAKLTTAHRVALARARSLRAWPPRTNSTKASRGCKRVSSAVFSPRTIAGSTGPQARSCRPSSARHSSLLRRRCCWTTRTQLAGGSATVPVSKQVLIIGGGVIGLSTAYYTARKGHQVAVLDRGTIEQENCSYGNAGLVVPSHFVPLAAPGMVVQGLKWMLKPASPFYVKPRLDRDLLDWGFKFWRAANAGHVSRSAPLLRDLNLAGRTCFEELAELTGNAFGLEKKGLLCLCKTEHRLEEEVRTAGQARQLGLNAEVLSARQAMDLDPQVRLDIVGAVYFRDDCHLIPALFMAALKQQLVKLGVKFLWQTELTGWRLNGHSIAAVRTAKDEFMAEEYVLCGGSWSPVAARELRLILPMQAGKGYNLTLPRPRQLPTIPAILTEARVAVTP